MRFMLFVHANIPDDADWGPSADDVGKMSKYNEELTKAGILLSLDGLHPPAEGAVVAFSGGKATVTDGPFAETKEVVGGYWLIQVKSREEALEWASRAPMGDGDAIEVRRVYEMSDFPQDVQDAAQLSETPPEQTFSN
jgi:hypothetical protein